MAFFARVQTLTWLSWTKSSLSDYPQHILILLWFHLDMAQQNFTVDALYCSTSAVVHVRVSHISVVHEILRMGRLINNVWYRIGNCRMPCNGRATGLQYAAVCSDCHHANSFFLHAHSCNNCKSLIEHFGIFLHELMKRPLLVNELTYTDMTSVRCVLEMCSKL